MGSENSLWKRLAESSRMPNTVFGKAIIEIVDDRRILIENHLGVMGYSCERILVKVSFGVVCICGAHLEIIRMTKEQLVICGRIEMVSIQRRDKI